MLCRYFAFLYFNSRPREEVDILGITDRRVRQLFQLTTSQGGRPEWRLGKIGKSSLSTHDLTRRSTLFTGKLWQDREFQLTTSRGGRPRPFRSGPFFTHFNSRPHEEVDAEDPKHNSGNCISTHDLTRRSTVTSCNTEKEIEISTHDLTRRSTATHFFILLILNHFNSRPHEEVDEISRYLFPA